MMISMMPKRTFGQTGLQVSALGWGGAPAAYLAADKQQTVSMLNKLLDAGMNVIDTAASYPGSEKFIGENLSHRRKDFVLISKCGSKIPESDGEPWSEKLVLDTVDRALKLLKTDVIDVMLLHSCDLATLKKGEAMGALLKAREAGKIRFAGYSGDNDAAEFATTIPDVAVIETSINLVDQLNLNWPPQAEENRIGVIATPPIANAAWKQIQEQPGMYQSYAKQYTDRFRAMGLKLSDLGYKDGDEHAWPEAALRFTLSQSGVHTAIIGTTNPKHAEANLIAATQGPLSADAVGKIRAVFRQANQGGKWTGQT
jgi:aryl-alcohol dehydrogenase-like predicted oxidoreductase